MDAAISTATLIRYALTTLGIFALIFLLTLLTPWMAKKVDAWIARYRENHSKEKNETYGVHSIYELPPEKPDDLSEIPQDNENQMLEEVTEEAWKEEKPIVPEVDWFEDSPSEDASETRRLFPKLDVPQQSEQETLHEEFQDSEEEESLFMEDSPYDELEEDEDIPVDDVLEEPEDDDPMAMRQLACDMPEDLQEDEPSEPETPPFMNICGILSGIEEPTYPPEGLEMVTSVFYEEPYPQAIPQQKKPVPTVQQQPPQPEPVSQSVLEPESIFEEAEEELAFEPVQDVQQVRVKEHAKKEEVDALLGKLIDKGKSSFRHWEADPYDEEAEELDEEDFEYDDDNYDDDEEDFDDDEVWFRPAY